MVAVTLMWSIAGVVTRHLEQARSFEVTFWRSFFTRAVAAGDPALRAGPRGCSPGCGTAAAALWLSGLCWSVMFTAFMVALTLTSVANVLVTMALGPLLTALIARVFIGHRMPARTWVAIAGGRRRHRLDVRRAGRGGPLGRARWWRCACRWPAAINWTITQRSHAQGAGRRTWCPPCWSARCCLGAGHAAAGPAVPGLGARHRPAGPAGPGAAGDSRACWRCVCARVLQGARDRRCWPCWR